jgi:hypothetical protein
VEGAKALDGAVAPRPPRCVLEHRLSRHVATYVGSQIIHPSSAEERARLMAEPKEAQIRAAADFKGVRAKHRAEEANVAGIVRRIQEIDPQR